MYNNQGDPLLALQNVKKFATARSTILRQNIYTKSLFVLSFLKHSQTSSSSTVRQE